MVEVAIVGVTGGYGVVVVGGGSHRLLSLNPTTVIVDLSNVYFITRCRMQQN